MTKQISRPVFIETFMRQTFIPQRRISLSSILFKSIWNIIEFGLYFSGYFCYFDCIDFTRHFKKVYILSVYWSHFIFAIMPSDLLQMSVDLGISDWNLYLKLQRLFMFVLIMSRNIFSCSLFNTAQFQLFPPSLSLYDSVQGLNS